MYALVEIKGKQYKVEQDAVIRVDHLDSEQGSTVEFPTVVLLRDDKTTTVGTPYVDGAVVKAEVEDHIRDRKQNTIKRRTRNIQKKNKKYVSHPIKITIRKLH